MSRQEGSMDVLDLAQSMKAKSMEMPEQLKEKPIHEYLIKNSTPERGCLFLHNLVQDIRPRHCIEIGTCLGFSTLFIIDALNKNGFGDLVTIEKNVESSALAQHLLSIVDMSRVQFKVGTSHEVLPEILEDWDEVDFCYIDGEHKKETVLFEFGVLYPKLYKDGIIVMNDVIGYNGVIGYNDGEMREAWAEIKLKEGVMWSEHERFGIIKKRFSIHASRSHVPLEGKKK